MPLKEVGEREQPKSHTKKKKASLVLGKKAYE